MQPSPSGRIAGDPAPAGDPPRRLELFVPLRERIFRAALLRALAGCRTVLDAGCGSASPLAQAGFPGLAIGADIAPTQLAAARRLGFHAALVRADVAHLGAVFAPRSVDAAVALDVIEHLERPAAERLLADLERIARRRVVVFTPNGFVPQTGTAENPFQEHRSGFSPEELRARGFTVHGMLGLRPLFGGYGEVRLRPGWLWRRVADLSAPLVYARPGSAFALLATKALPAAGA